MARRLDQGENPFRERNAANARRRAELVNPKRERLNELERYLNERHQRMREERGGREA